MDIIQHPDYLALKEYCDLLQESLLELILEKDELLTTIIPNIEAEYQLRIGSLAFERFCLQTEINKAKRIMEIIQTAINHNDKVSGLDIEKRLKIEFTEWENRLKEHLQMIKDARQREKSRLSVEESRMICEIYRNLVKILHPDINPELYSRNLGLWSQIQEAYKNADVSSLEALWLIVQDMGQPPEEMPVMERLMEKESSLKKSIREVREIIAEITSGHPYILKDNLMDTAWVEEQRRKLKEEISELAVQNSKFKILAEQMTREHCHG